VENSRITLSPNKNLIQEQGVDRQLAVKHISFDTTNSLTTLIEQGVDNTQHHLDRHCYYDENDKQAICVFEDEKGQKIIFDENLLSKHLLFIGGIGSGKTTVICQTVEQIQANLSENDVMIIFDAKGNYYHEFYRHGIDVVISNDEKSIGVDGKKDYWNIFNEIELDSHMEENIIEISKTLFNEKIVKSHQPFFSLAAKDLFSAVLFHCCRDEEKSFHNSDLRRFWESANVEIILQMLNLHNDLKAMKNYIGDGTSSQALDVLAELQELVRKIFVGNFKQKGTLSMRKLVREKKGRTIFIEHDMGICKTLAPIYSLLFDLAIKETLCRTKSEGNVYFIADEFELLSHLQHVDNAVNFGRSLSVRFLIGVQNIEPLYEVYSDSKRARTLLSSFSTSICFRVNNEEETREYIKNLHGKSIKLETYMSSITNRVIEEKIREAYVVEDWDILQLGTGQAIIGLPNKPPFLFKFKEHKSKNKTP